MLKLEGKRGEGDGAKMVECEQLKINVQVDEETARSIVKLCELGEKVVQQGQYCIEFFRIVLVISNPNFNFQPLVTSVVHDGSS